MKIGIFGDFATKSTIASVDFTREFVVFDQKVDFATKSTIVSVDFTRGFVVLIHFCIYTAIIGHKYTNYFTGKFALDSWFFSTAIR